MSWCITKDHIGEGEAERIIGPQSTALNAEEIMSHPDAKPFSMYDDDMILYYEGFWVDDEHADSELDPLDDFGMPNAGAVHIKMAGSFI